MPPCAIAWVTTAISMAAATMPKSSGFRWRARMITTAVRISRLPAALVLCQKMPDSASTVRLLFFIARRWAGAGLWKASTCAPPRPARGDEVRASDRAGRRRPDQAQLLGQERDRERSIERHDLQSC